MIKVTDYKTSNTTSELKDYKTQTIHMELKDADDMLTHDEMCVELAIKPSTGYDWRKKGTPRYKEDLAKLAIYLSEKTVRFRRGDIREFALNRKMGVKS